MHQRNAQLEEKVATLLNSSESKDVAAAASATKELRAHSKQLEKEGRKLRKRIEELERTNAALTGAKGPLSMGTWQPDAVCSTRQDDKVIWAACVGELYGYGYGYV